MNEEKKRERKVDNWERTSGAVV